MGELVGLDSCSQSFLTHLPMVRSWDIITTKNFELGTHSARNGPGGLQCTDPERSRSDPGTNRQRSRSDPAADPANFAQFGAIPERSRTRSHAQKFAFFTDAFAKL